MIRVLIFCVLGFGFPALATHGDKPREVDPVAKQIAEHIQSLSSQTFTVRRDAENALEKLGTNALPQLRQSLRNPVDLEMSRRIERLIQKIEPTLGWDQIVDTIVRKSDELPDAVDLRKNGQGIYSAFTAKEYKELRDMAARNEALVAEYHSLIEELKRLQDLGKGEGPEADAVTAASRVNERRFADLANETSQLYTAVLGRYGWLIGEPRSEFGGTVWNFSREGKRYEARFTPFSFDFSLSRVDARNGAYTTLVRPERMLPANGLYPDGSRLTRVIPPLEVTPVLHLYPQGNQTQNGERAALYWGKDYDGRIREHYFNVFAGLTRERIGLPPPKLTLILI